jgi:4-carboxymuconolactone decarboxylase
VATVTPRTSSSRNEVRTVAPKLIELSETVLYGDVWERPGLSKRDRSLITVTHLAFYSGWPTAMTAGRVAKQVFEEKKS